jgi:hypothetical protein
MITKTLIALFGALALVMAVGLGHPRASAASSQNEGLSSLSTESLARLANSRIFFGHMSVGQNIIEGIEDLLAQHPTLKLNIVQTDAPDLSSPGFLAHGPVGENWKPLEKIDDFDKKISGGLGEKTDIAFFKFCYIDMMAENTEDQDVDKVFSRYQQTMAKLKTQYPNTRFVHFTAP